MYAKFLSLGIIFIAKSGRNEYIKLRKGMGCLIISRFKNNDFNYIHILLPKKKKKHGYVTISKNNFR